MPSTSSVAGPTRNRPWKSVGIISASHLASGSPSPICRRGKKSVPSMNKKSNSKSAFFNLRVSTAAVFCVASIVAVLFAVITIEPAVGKVDFVPGDGSPTPTPTPVSCSWSTGQDWRASALVWWASFFQEIFTMLVILAAAASPPCLEELSRLRKVFRHGRAQCGHTWERFRAPVRV